MNRNEKNMVFICVLVLLGVTIIGIGAVDSNLSRLMLPEEDYSTFSIAYDHGLVVGGGDREFSLSASTLANIEINGDRAGFEIGGFQIQIPLTIQLGSIERIRSRAGMLTK